MSIFEYNKFALKKGSRLRVFISSSLKLYFTAILILFLISSQKDNYDNILDSLPKYETTSYSLKKCDIMKKDAITISNTDEINPCPARH